MAAEALVLKAQDRAERGKERSIKIRRGGRIPAVVYGAGGESRSITLDAHEFDVVRKKSAGQAVLIQLELPGGGSDNIFVREVQRDPASREVLHVDLLRVDMAHEITIYVAVHPVGVAQGVKDGGILESVMHRIQIRCLPNKVPSHINVDVSSLGAGHTIHVRDLPVLDGVAYLGEPSAAVFSVVAKMKEEEVVAPTAAVAEPEVVGGKKPEEGAAGDEKKDEKKAEEPKKEKK